MTDANSPTILDFNTPRRPTHSAQRQMARWQSQVCVRVQEAWCSLLAHPVSLTSQGMEPAQFHAALGKLPEEGLGVYLTIGEAMLPGMLVFSPRHLQALLADLIDLDVQDCPEPRPLTAVEESMLEILFQKMGEAMGEAWPGERPIRCRFLETTLKPQRTRLFPPGSPLFVGSITVSSRFGDETLHWLMLKEDTEEMILESLEDLPQEERRLHPALVALAERVPVEIRVALGSATLSMSQIDTLNVGDVVILDQFVRHPLPVFVDGQPKWAGLPMRIGSRQAFEITQVIDQPGPVTLAAPPTGTATPQASRRPRATAPTT